MKMYCIAMTLTNDTAHIVIKNCPGCPTPIREGMDVTEQEIFYTLIKKEFYPQRTRITERDHETRKFPAGGADSDLSEVRPISLCLLTRQCVEPQKSFLFIGPQPL